MLSSKIHKYENKYKNANTIIKKNIYKNKLDFYKKLENDVELKSQIGGVNEFSTIIYEMRDNHFKNMSQFEKKIDTIFNEEFDSINAQRLKFISPESVEYQRINNNINNKIDPYQLINKDNGTIDKIDATREHVIPQNAYFFDEKTKNENFFFKLFTKDTNMIVLSDKSIQHFKGESFFSEKKKEMNSNLYKYIIDKRKITLFNHMVGFNRNGEDKGNHQCYKNSVIDFNSNINFNYLYVRNKLLVNHLWNTKNINTDCLKTNFYQYDSIIGKNNKNIENIIYQNFEYNIDENINALISTKNKFFLADPIVFITPKHNGLKIIIALAYLYFHITYKSRMGNIIDENIYNYMLQPLEYIKWLLPDILATQLINNPFTDEEIVNNNNYYKKYDILKVYRQILQNKYFANSKVLTNPFYKIINQVIKNIIREDMDNNKLQTLRTICIDFINNPFPLERCAF